MTTVRSKVCVIRGDERFVQKACCDQSCRAQYNGVHQMNDIRRELAEAAYEERAKKVKLKLWIKWKRYSRGANKFSSSILLHATFRTQEQRLVTIRL